MVFYNNHFDIADKYNSTVIIKIQAFVRGWLSRKKLLESHKEFQLIVKDIEGPDVVAQWPTYFSSFPDLVHSSHELTQSKMKHINDAKRIFNDNPEQPVLFHSSLNTVEVLQPTKNVEHDHRSSGSFIQNTNLRKGNDDHSLASIVTLPEECGAFELRYSAPVKLDGDRYSSEKPGTEFCGAGSSASMTTVSIAVSHRSNGKDSGADQPSSNPASLECNSLDKSFSSCMPVKDDLTNCHSDGLAGNVAEADGNKGMSALTSFSADQTSLWDDGLDETQEVICHKNTFDQYGSCPVISDREELKGIFQSYLMPMDELRNLSCAELLKQRQNLAMELLWIQQAITSRTEYLTLRAEMSD